jgi:hypothetical protein
VTAKPAFASQVFGPQTLRAREFYSWTSDEQALGLRQDRMLFSQAAGSGAPFTMLRKVTSDPGVDDTARLAQTLAKSFAMGRFAWPEPWATRMGWPGQDPGHQLLRILLKPEARLAFVINSELTVFDARGLPVPIADAAAHPEQIGVVYFDTAASDPFGCGSGTGYREFLLGNLAMVQEWSLGTQQIADRIRSNIAELTQFLNDIRSCPVTSDSATWARSVLCSWQVGDAGASGQELIGGFAGSSSSAGAPAGASAGAAASGSGGKGPSSFEPAPGAGFSGAGAPIASSDQSLYEQALAIPSANYLAAPAQIAAMIDTLTGDLFEPEPLLVTPGSP